MLDALACFVADHVHTNDSKPLFQQCIAEPIVHRLEVGLWREQVDLGGNGDHRIPACDFSDVPDVGTVKVQHIHDVYHKASPLADDPQLPQKNFRIHHVSAEAKLLTGLSTVGSRAQRLLHDWHELPALQLQTARAHDLPMSLFGPRVEILREAHITNITWVVCLEGNATASAANQPLKLILPTKHEINALCQWVIRVWIEGTRVASRPSRHHVFDECLHVLCRRRPRKAPVSRTLRAG
mmetsp:Transcript_3985/g.7687  ORF Transcript_3985/g.7687 Transcript_3985/m.7687 type:complete len:239 (+) Transcript_3985:698-1414(+)